MHTHLTGKHFISLNHHGFSFLLQLLIELRKKPSGKSCINFNHGKIRLFGLLKRNFMTQSYLFRMFHIYYQVKLYQNKVHVD